MTKTDEDWKAKLTPEEYEVTRACGTEPAFTGRYWNEKRAGTYKCVCCDELLFLSDEKYDSGSGWPSFWQPASEEAVAVREDRSHGMLREEILCARCDAHLGHRFSDGPPPTGVRFCINSLSLSFESKSEPEE